MHGDSGESDKSRRCAGRGFTLRRWRSTRPPLWWAGAALVPFVTRRYCTTVVLTAAAGISLLVLVLAIAVVTWGAAFGRGAVGGERACRLLRCCFG